MGSRATLGPLSTALATHRKEGPNIMIRTRHIGQEGCQPGLEPAVSRWRCGEGAGA